MIRLIQRIGQNLLLRVEKGFNAIFGPELNPLYQLGAITFFLFWVVLGSGFYLYAFYRTGVNEAYSSVDKITHEQWYLGGIMRSLHRYASDGMVVLVLAHMARNFVMNRLSGFRAFSWITGIVLLLLLIISGINGYWLVWDKLAQFVAVASTEFLDWLPVFVSPLVRNFLTPDSINDRFFSLLSFAHLGIPLGMLIFIMVHTQRVSKARTQPSRQLAIGLGLTLLALALVKPALSQGGQADLSTVALQIKLDWFFMAIYPLMYTWTPGQLWALVGGFLAFLLLLPLLARTKRLKEGYQITTAPSMRTFAAKPDETVLEAALRQDVHLPYTCRDGACGNCKGTILHGAVDYGVYQHDALSEQEKQAGKALFCCAKPLSDLEIEYYENETLKQVPVKVMQCHVHNMVRATPDVMILYLKFPQGKKLQFLAGQYFDILLEDGARRSFSFANAPYDDEFIQLHVRLIPGGRFTTHVFTQMKVGDELNIEGPLGTFFLHEESDKPIIFVAGATGFAPVKSMLDQAFHTGSKRRMLLYWGVRMRKDLYMADLPERWQREHDNFTFIPVLSEASPEDNWQGRTGLVHEAILQDFPDLSGFQIYSCGSLQMVQAARPAFVAQGLPENACFSDAFLLPAHKAAQPAAEAQP
ncbi:MAG: cytochrome b N-terminal domain-containing protein [Betaproteobacteria bacterium]|nr:cytochrome b N-terminal domain-containing protein [Betaproteobacteria bacterium]